MRKTIVTRFAPSPTGHLHIGGARTAIFNWLFARHNKGRFILRIEDTDLQRSEETYTKAIIDAMSWLGLDWDEGPYFQRDRLPLYRDYAQKLYDSGWAYYCECSPEEVEKRRQEAFSKGLKPKYDGLCRDKGFGPAPGRVLRFKCPQTGTTVLKDLIKGPMVFANEELDDLVLIRSDGMPTYNFSVVIDDITMAVTHVIRGDDHVNNTPKQILIYQALGEPLPEFAHVPLILGADRKRLSKRHGATSVMAYKEMGYLAEALLNYLVRLGWSWGDQEIFDREELVEKFALEKIGSSSSIFDMEKLRWLNGHYIKVGDPSRLVKLLEPFLKEKGYPEKPLDYIKQAVKTLQPRCPTLLEMAEAIDFYLLDDVSYNAEGARKFLTEETLPVIEKIVVALESRESLDESSLENILRAFSEEYNIKLKIVAQAIRVSLTGRTASPGLFEVMDILGKEVVVKRLKKAADFIKQSSKT